jgi:hypothetical protein
MGTFQKVAVGARQKKGALLQIVGSQTENINGIDSCRSSQFNKFIVVLIGLLTQGVPISGTGGGEEVHSKSNIAGSGIFERA